MRAFRRARGIVGLSTVGFIVVVVSFFTLRFAPVAVLVPTASAALVILTLIFILILVLIVSSP